MSKNIKYGYEKHIRDTAPDMERLWERIDKEIDKTEAENKRSYENITVTRRQNYSRYIAAAAAVAVVIVGASVFTRNSSKVNSTDIKSDSVSAGQDERAGTDEPAQEDKVTEEKQDIEGVSLTDKRDTAVQNAGEAETAAEEETDDFTSDTNNELTPVRNTVEYNALPFAPTDTVAYSSSYIPGGDEFFVEEKVLESTDAFIDVTVKDVALTSEGGSYTLQVNSVYDKKGSFSGNELTIFSTTPYILQKDREYLIPISYDGESCYIVFENAPQIEITLDGGAVFQNGWSITSFTDVDKEELSVNDFYYDRLCYCESYDLEEFIERFEAL